MNPWPRAALLVSLPALALAGQNPSPPPPAATAMVGQLLQLVNQARADYKLQPLVLDTRLSAAAQKHSALMAEQRTLAHDFPGEPALVARLTAAGAHFSQAGENLADSASPRDAEMEWMLSTPHRANLLNPDFNGIGIGVLPLAENRVFFTADFAQRVPAYSPEQLEQLVLGQLNQLRSTRGLPPLADRHIPMLRQEACRAQLNAQALGRAFASAAWVSVVTSADPGDLPDVIGQTALRRGAQSVALGACYPPGSPGGFSAFRVIAIFFRKPGA